MTRLRVSEVEVDRPDGVEDGAVVSVFRVPPELAGQRLDVFLQGQLKRTSRTRTQEIIRNSAYDRYGKRLRPNHRMQDEELVLLWRPAWDEDPVPTDVPILYEDEHIFAVNKPALLPVHPTARYHKNTLIEILKRERPGQFVSLGHRIDRETSGVLLVTKNALCDRTLKKALENRDAIDKTYLALTWGTPDRTLPIPGAVISTYGEGFRFDRSLELDPTSRYKVKMRLGETDEALTAATRFLVEETRGNYSRVRCDLESGRQHQIRVHLQALGSPIVGDKLYGPDETCFPRGADGLLTAEDYERLELPRHALHAARMALSHPVTKEPLVIEAPLPDDLAAFWSDLDPNAERRTPNAD